MEQDTKYVLCPYCGHPQSASDRCAECGGLFEPLSRRATQIAMGPWYIRDKNRPFRPGCSYEVLARQIKAGKIKSTTVLRGPTTKQFWAVARNVPGIAHLLGYCHRCGAHVSPNLQSCPQCSEPFQAPTERNELGLMYPTEATAQAAQRLLEKEMAQQTGMPYIEAPAATAAGSASTLSSPAVSPTPPAVPGGDLLQEILGKTSITASNAGVSSAGQAPAVKPVLPPAPPPLPGGPVKMPDAPRSRLLRFDEDTSSGDTKVTVTSTGGKASQSVEALDFAPSDQATEEGEPTASGLRLSVTTWLLILINVLVLVGVIMLFWLYFKGRDGHASLFNPNPSPDQTALASPTASTQNNQSTGSTVTQPITLSLPGSNTNPSKDSAASKGNSTGQAPSKAPSKPTASANDDPLYKACQQAQTMVNDRRYAEALSILQSAKPLARTPENLKLLDENIALVRKLIADSKSSGGHFYSIPTR